MNMKKIKLTNQPAPIGVFDSGFGGLSILREIRKVLPEYDYIFLATMPVRPMVHALSHLCMNTRCKPFNTSLSKGVRL